MKLISSNNAITIYDNINIDFENKKNIETYFKEIFLKLKTIFNIELKGFYLIKIYYDNYIGMIIEIEKEEMEYDFYEEIDMKIVIENTSFLYKISDIFIDKKILDNIDIIKHDSKLYVKVNDKLTNIKIGYLFEIGEIVYKDTKYIIDHSEKLL